MTYLPNLIKKIDDFYSLTESMTRFRRMAAPETWHMPDDEEELPDEGLPGDEGEGLYPAIMSKIETLSNPKNDFKFEDVANDLRLMAALYKKVLEINGGYRFVQDKLARTMANIDMLLDDFDGPLGDDAREISDEIIEDISGDLRLRAKGSIGPVMPEEEAAKILKNVQDEYNRAEARAEIENQKSVYKRNNKPGENPGQSTIKIGPETPEKYTKELGRLRENYMAEEDEDNKKGIAELMKTIVDLINQMHKVKEVTDALKITPEDEEEIAKLETATLELERLRHQRTIQKKRLNQLIFAHDQRQLEAQMSNASPQEQKWLQVKIDLLKLRANEKILKKRDLIKAVNTLVNTTGTVDVRGDFHALNTENAELYNKLRAAIDVAKETTITKADYDRGLTEQRGKNQGREDIPKMPNERGGYRPTIQKDFNKFTFPGLIKELRDRKNTAIDSARRYIANAKEGGRVELKEDVKAVSDAIRRSDANAKMSAINNLRNKIKADFIKSHGAFQSYRRSLKLVPYINYFEKAFDDLAGMQNAQGVWQLPNNEFIFGLTDEIKKFTEQYARYYQSKERPVYTKDIKPRFDAVVTFLNGKIRPYILNEILTVEESGKTASRASLFYEIVKHSQLTQSERDRARTEQKGREQARDAIPRHPNTKGGPRQQLDKLPYLARPDLEMASFSGLINDFQVKINTAFSGVKQLMHRPKSGGDPIFKTVVDELASAIVKRDTQAKYRAIQKIKEMASQYSRQHISTSAQKTIQISKVMGRLRGLGDDFKTIAKWQDVTNNDWHLDEHQKSFVLSTLHKSKLFLQYLHKYKDQNHFGSTIISLTNVINYLEYIKEEISL